MNNRIYLFIFLFGIQFCIFSCTSEENATTSEEITSSLEAATFLNVSYGPNEQQVYDLYLPEARTSETTKVILLVHGGGWTAGDKESMDSFVQSIQQNHPTHAIVNINYVLARVSQPVIPAFPNQFLDIDAVVNKITSEKETLQILPEFGMIGVSAGAHLSLMYDFVYDVDDQVKFVADIVGPTDFTDPFYANNPDFTLALSLFIDQSQYQDGTNLAEATSPVFQVNKRVSPVALFYGNEDPLVPLTNAESLERSLNDAKITHSFTTYNGGHGNWNPGDMLNMQTQISEYIEAYLPVD